SSDREYREIQLSRITALFKSDSVEERLVDEQKRQLQSARAGEEGAQAEVINAKAQVHAAEARVVQAKADAVAARANLEVAQAALDKAQVFVEYLKIVSPYDGVVVKRNFFRGDFIRSADQQMTLPLLAIDRTDEMRVIVQVPDPLVPFTRKGAPAAVKIDALPGRLFESTVARVALAEHHETRTMRAEIDLKNDQNQLSPGMYGYATITLPSSPDALRIPTTALVGAATDGMGTICLVKDGVVKVVKVRVGRDDGSQIEVLDGLSRDDEVAVTHAADLAEGMHVHVLPAGEKPHSTSQASLP
ncbi:MAG TPA: efflux RND transporter periplasmic adaptor subunit, partial [Pirellulales bacterium]|nr:efflux RND transporter periplasmic adaptor subunit [Pirellulales bacterium]